MNKPKTHNIKIKKDDLNNIQGHNFAGNYICNVCNQKISLSNKAKGHLKNCHFNYINEYQNNQSAMTFTINEQSKEKLQNKLYSNSDFSIDNKYPDLNDFFNLSDKIFHKIIEKLAQSNFLIKNLQSEKINKIQDLFIKVSPSLKSCLNSKEERIYYGKVVIFEDIYHKTPVFRLSFQDLKNENFHLKFKVYSNTQQPEIKKLYKELLLIPSKNKKRVSCNSGSYTLGKSIFIRGVLKENSNNLYFTDIKNIWLCDADNKYDKIFNI